MRIVMSYRKIFRKKRNFSNSLNLSIPYLKWNPLLCKQIFEKEERAQSQI